jgi:hypothetical protein
MATAQPSLQVFQTGQSLIRFMAIALATGFLFDVLLPAAASFVAPLFVTFVAGIRSSPQWIVVLPLPNKAFDAFHAFDASGRASRAGSTVWTIW